MTQFSTPTTSGIWQQTMAGRRELQWVPSRLPSRLHKRRRLTLGNFAPYTKLLGFYDRAWVADPRSGAWKTAPRGMGKFAMACAWGHPSGDS